MFKHICTPNGSTTALNLLWDRLGQAFQDNFTYISNEKRFNVWAIWSCLRVPSAAHLVEYVLHVDCVITTVAWVQFQQFQRTPFAAFIPSLFSIFCHCGLSFHMKAQISSSLIDFTLQHSILYQKCNHSPFYAKIEN